MAKTWQVQEAKNRFSQLLREAAREPQVITKNGKEAGVVLSYEQYQRNVKTATVSIKNLFARAPKMEEGELDIARSADRGRNLEL